MILSSGGVARVSNFWRSVSVPDGGEAPVVVQCTLCEQVAETLLRDTDAVSLIDGDSIVDAMMYKSMKDAPDIFGS